MPSTTNVKQSIRNYSSIGCRHALLCQSFCCANYTDRLQLMRLASTYQVDHAVIVSDLIPLKDAVQIFRTNRPIIVSAEPIEGARVSCARGDGAGGGGGGGGMGMGLWGRRMMGSWEWNDLTSLALDHVAFIDAIVQLIERRETRDGAAPNHCSQMHGSVGFNRLHTGKSGRRRFASDISFENAGLSLAVRD